MDAIEEINENISLTDSRDGKSFCFVFKQQNRKQVEEETEKRERVNAQTIQRTQTQRERGTKRRKHETKSAASLLKLTRPKRLITKTTAGCWMSSSN